MKLTVTQTLTFGGKSISTSAEYEEPGFPLAVARNGRFPHTISPDIEAIGKQLRAVLAAPSSKPKQKKP